MFGIINKDLKTNESKVYPNKIIQKGKQMYSLHIFLLLKRIKFWKRSKCPTKDNAYIMVYPFYIT